MISLPVHVFQGSFRPFTELLNEYGVKYHMREARMGVPMASSGILEIAQAVGVASMWGGLAAVLIAFIRGRTSRKVIITTKDNTVIHAEGLTSKELERVLGMAANVTVIETGKAAVKRSESGT